MNASHKAQENEQDRFDQLYPNPGDPSLPLPRFGKVGPSRVVALTPPGSEARSGPCREPFHLVWEDPDLGIRVDCLEESGPTGPEIVAWVTGRFEQQGQSLVFALEAAQQLKFLQRTVVLALDEHQVCGGRVSFGPVAEVLARLGESVTAEGYLLVPLPQAQSGQGQP